MPSPVEEIFSVPASSPDKNKSIYLDSQSSIDNLVKLQLPESGIISLDTEFERRTTFYPKPALLQLDDGKNTYLIDTVDLESLDGLFELLSEKRVIMHACREDLEVFRVLSKNRLNEFYDTQIAASLLGFESQISYQSLVEVLLGHKIKKDETCSDWLQRPLSDEQIEYAKNDVIYLEDVFSLLQEKLVNSKREQWFMQEMNLLFKLLNDPEHDDYFFKMKGLGKLDDERLSIAYDLIVWRDEIARLKNVPRGFIIKDKGLIQLIKTSNRSRFSDFYNFEDVPNGFLKRHKDKLIDILNNPSESDKKSLAMKIRSWSEPSASKSFKKHLKKQRDKLSLELDIKPEVLLSNKMMAAISESIYFYQKADDDALSEILHPWRYELFKTVIQDNI